MSRYTMDTVRRRRLIDQLFETYVNWREASAQVNNAYRSWVREPGTAGGVAFGLYMAALDAEKQAAEAYAEVVQRAEKLSWSEAPPTESRGGTTRRGGL